MGNAATKPEDRSTPAAKESKETPAKKSTPRRRDSIQVLPHTRASAAPPAASLESAEGHHSTSNDFPSTAPSPTSQQTRHARGRSQTTAAPISRAEEPAQQTASQTWSSNQSNLQPLADTSLETRERSPAMAVNVPRPNQAYPYRQSDVDFNAPPQPSFMQHAQYLRPPRLPLPIEEEALAPGSPIISPADFSGQLGSRDLDSLPKRSSVISSTTLDDEEVDDFSLLPDSTQPTVNTLIEWKDGDAKAVYVTGSFWRWGKKHRLSRIKETNFFSAMIALPQGTHHLTFLVDNNMITSKHMPTAVDYTNALVNWLIITSEDIEASKAQQGPLKPGANDISQTNLDKAHSSTSVSQEYDPPSHTPAPEPTLPHKVPAKRLPEKAYHMEIPRFLTDLDADESSSRLERANAVLAQQPTPPSLPMFLNKSILNGSLPMKDDSSVLIMPNHTVLNHLATSSIKSNVLATSATTRYKSKYVTTIMYRPSKDD